MSSTRCTHNTLTTVPSIHAAHVEYNYVTAEKCLAATTPSGRAPKEPKEPQNAPSSWTFPAPAILPGDELAYDPEYPPQSFRSWKHDKDRNEVKPDRCTIYVAAPPKIEDDDAFIRDWARSPLLDGGEEGKVAQPKTDDVIDYLAAFYHPLPVRRLPAAFRFTTWDADPPAKKSKSRSSASVKHVAFAYGESATRVRVRPREVEVGDDVYTHTYQLNLDDILDGVIDALPSDAYSLLLLVEHDLYEGDDDDFCCGRAYGGSRVAVVSSARYHPGLDAAQGLREGREHAWPASRCAAYVQESIDAEHQGQDARKKRSNKARRTMSQEPEPPALDSPLRLAVVAFLEAQPPTGKRALELLYLGRFVLTASHELGHTLGLDHCVYYSCLMGGTASLKEDMRGAPYLCPVCSAKVGAARAEASGSVKTAVTTSAEKAELEMKTRLRDVCVRWKEGVMFRAFGAWIGDPLIPYM